VNIVAAVIAGAVSANSVQAAPVGLASTVALATAKGAAASGSILAIVNGVLKAMAWSKLAMPALLGATLLA